MKKTIEKVVESERFSMNALCTELTPLLEGEPSIAPHITAARNRLGTDFRKVLAGIIRHVFLIELVKVPKIETTKFRTRWFNELQDDPRWCSFDECLAIAGDLMGGLRDGWLDTKQNKNVLDLCLAHSLLPYEIPLDYESRPAPEDASVRIHRRGNLVWTCTDHMLRTLRLRKFLTDAKTSPDALFFSKVLDDKITVKTYLTDRVLTGEHKTNREKRWEVHPKSVHFATRRTCMAIEYTLIQQLCAFEGFPERSRQILQSQGVLPEGMSVFRCPVTLEPMSFSAFRAELQNPTHGKSNFQVGHLNPLKLDDPTGGASGHTADNISWVSANGNRIQGSLSLSEVRDLLRKIAANYAERNWT
jgi:hypothetical protein